MNGHIKARMRIISVFLVLVLVSGLMPLEGVLNLTAYGASANLGHSSATVKVILNGEPTQISQWVELYAKDAGESQFSIKNYLYVDSQGEVTLNNLEVGSQYYFYVPSDNYNYPTYDGKELGKIFTYPDLPKEIMLNSRVQVTASVFLNNQPASGIQVELRKIGIPSMTATSDDNGKVSFNSVEPGNDYYLVVYNTPAYALYNGEDLGKTFSVPLSGEAPAIHLDPGNQISTTVTFNGKAVSNASVWLFRKDGSALSIEGLNRADGVVDFPAVPNGEYYFDVVATDDYEYDGSDIDMYFTVPGTIPAIELMPSYSATTTVTLNGVPQNNVKVDIVRSGYYGRGDVEYTDSQGRVTFNRLSGNGSYYFRVDRTNTHAQYDGSELGKTFKGNVTAPAIQLDPGHSITTRVLFNGVPQSNISVNLCAAGHDTISATSDVNGFVTFTTLSPTASYYFWVSADSNDPFAVYDGKFTRQSFKVTDTIPTIDLEPANTVTAQVFLDGTPVSDIRIELDFSRTQNGGVARTGYWRTYPDENGNVTFTNVPAATKAYFIVRSNRGDFADYNGRTLGNIFSIPGNAPNIMLERGHTVTTTVRLNGTPARNVWVSITNGRGARTDENGRVALTNVATQSKAYFSVSRERGLHAQYVGAAQGITFATPSEAYPEIDLITGVTAFAKFTYNGRPPVGYEYDLYQMTDLDTRVFIDTFLANENGEVTLTNIAPGDNYYFEAYNNVAGSIYYDGFDQYRFSIPGTIKTIELNASKPSDSGSSDSGSDRSERVGIDYTKQSSNDSGNITTAAAQAAAKSSAAKAGDTGVATVRLKNPGSISLAALQAMTQAAGMPTKIHADSMSADGESVEVRISFDPAKAVKDISLSASARNSTAKARETLFSKWFSNTVQVISFEQQGAFGFPVEIAVKMREKNADIKNLVFYSYNQASNSYQRIPDPLAWIDVNGYIHFTTSYAGDIIISKGILTRT
ncbi:hypothetical protein U6B65_02205 [Oscillospiraceae bacterium MB08-C2-2]|nr:hypothetical protein U6B65_02205 [Oscillospiraceae bacterium MB08-C2-2]